MRRWALLLGMVAACGRVGFSPVSSSDGGSGDGGAPGDAGPLGTCPTAGLVAYWTLDDNTGTVAHDLIGDHDGVLENGVDWTTGRVGPGLSFDDVDDTVTVANSPALDLTSTFTIALWINKHTYVGYDDLVSKGDSGTALQWGLVTDDTELNIGFCTGAGALCQPYEEHITSGAGFQPDTWYHVATTFDDAANEIGLFIDGHVRTYEATTASLVSTTFPIQIGMLVPGEATDGLVDEVAIYDRVLGEAEIAALYGNGNGCR